MGHAYNGAGYVVERVWDGWFVWPPLEDDRGARRGAGWLGAFGLTVLSKCMCVCLDVYFCTVVPSIFLTNCHRNVAMLGPVGCIPCAVPMGTLFRVLLYLMGRASNGAGCDAGW